MLFDGLVGVEIHRSSDMTALMFIVKPAVNDLVGFHLVIIRSSEHVPKLHKKEDSVWLRDMIEIL